jgi:membrane protein DedA with SNARE-associated domain
LFDWLQPLLVHHGYWVIFLTVFLNNLGLPVPGDMTLLGGGFLMGKGSLSGWGVILAGTAGCFLGGNGSYWLGSHFGRRFLKKIRWLHLPPKRLEQTEHFFRKFGPQAVFFARFVALLHPVTGLLAGMCKTPFRPFLFYNLAGALAYSLLYALVGYFFGQKWELFKDWVGPVFLYVLIILIGLLILGWFLRRSIRAFLNDLSHR